MSLFTWFSRKSAAKPEADAESSGLGKSSVNTQPGSAANRKGERIERRELLYGIVRETMTGAGVLSSSYKFKVLSLDSRGVQFLIMMDLGREHASDTARLVEIESHIAQQAKARFGILVTSVYWRVSEQVTGDAIHSVAVAIPSHEPMHADDIEHFKQETPSAPPVQWLSAPGEIVHSGRRNPDTAPSADSTELGEPVSPPGRSQQGNLN